MSTTKSERSHPLIWVIGIVVFMAVIAAWGNYWFQQGKLTARAHDKQVSIPKEGPGEPDHATLMADSSDDMLKLGKAVYNANCIACHGADGGAGALATARVFNEDAFATDGYGADPWGMYQTLVLGYNAMPAQGALSPEEKWAVVTYIREEFLKPNNEAMYIALTDEYLGSPRAACARQWRWRQGTASCDTATGNSRSGYHGQNVSRSAQRFSARATVPRAGGSS